MSTTEPHKAQRVPPEYDETVVRVVASKILVDWLRNRQQLLVPLALDLQKLEEPPTEVLVHAMAAAAHAAGEFGEKERERLEAALERLNAGTAQREMFLSALKQPKPLSEILADVRDVRSGAVVYAVSALAVDRRKLVNRQYLRYLAARLDIPRHLSRSLEQRYRASA